MESLSLPQWYAILLGIFVIIHRLPGVFSPKFFRKIIYGFSKRKPLVIFTGLLFSLFSLWGIGATLFEYASPGWLLIGFSLVVLHKALKFLLNPTRAGEKEYVSWLQADQNVIMICVFSVLAGLFLIYFGAEMMG